MHCDNEFQGVAKVTDKLVRCIKKYGAHVERYDVGDLLAKVSLEDVATRLGIETERRGEITRALCPFHADTRPSLNLFPASGNSLAHYHCFACGAHGSAIDLVKEVEGLEFLPAVQWLAQQFGIKPFRKQASRPAGRDALSKTALQFALRIFDERHDTERFQGWCLERGFEPAFLYGHGLRCITHSVLVESLQAVPLGERFELIDELQRLGLIKRLRSYSPTTQGKLALLDQFQDCFHDRRVVIPIRSGQANRSKVVGFAGRALQNTPPEGMPKYLLTQGFEKSEYLFNEPEASKAIALALKNNKPAKLYLVEGFLDALRLQSLGQSAVALMGVNLGKGQRERLEKLAHKAPGNSPLTYCIYLDNDSAGFVGAERLARDLIGLHGVDLRWIGTPWRTEPSLGKDPDSSLRGSDTPKEASVWLERYDLPAEAVLLASALASQDASELQSRHWEKLAATTRERALFRTALAVKKLHGRRLPESVTARLNKSSWDWAQELFGMLDEASGRARTSSRGMYLNESHPRAALARSLAYHGSRRGELPCDEEAWQTLSGSERLFDQTAFARLRATVVEAKQWRQAAPFDAVNLPRKLKADSKVLEDPRLKVMPHPADLHVQQILLNELLTQRHDRLSVSGGAFSGGIPAVRWYGSRQKVEVTGPFELLNEPDLERGEPETLSFGYQVDMDVLEGDKTPSDQGMFRPFGQCWRAFMGCLSDQCQAIGPRVHVLRLDAKRYYDSIQRYLVRDALLEPLKVALTTHGVPEGFRAMFGLNDTDSPDWDAALERLVSGLVFEYEYRDPGEGGARRQSDSVMGIAQGPVLSAYLGTIALFPVDEAARRFMRDTAEEKPDGKWRQRTGYARYVDDIVLFAESQELLTRFREVLQAKSSELSIDLIHKGDRVRAGSPDQVMRQLNQGRGIAASVPAWETPIMGDGDSDWSLDDDIPQVDRQCALQLLRHPSLLSDPMLISTQVKAAALAPDLRPNDLALCARLLWWQVAATELSADGASAWKRFKDLWNEIFNSRPWEEAFRQRGYTMLYAVEGLDKLMDPNPWQANGLLIKERDDHRARRVHLARLVCEPSFFDEVRPAENFHHVRRRARLLARKARRLAHAGAVLVPPQVHEEERLSAIEWLCQASQTIAANPEQNPLAALRERELARISGDELMTAVIEQLKGAHVRSTAIASDPAQLTPMHGVSVIDLAIDFILKSSPERTGLKLLAQRFPALLSTGDAGNRHLIPQLPITGEVRALYGIDAQGAAASTGRRLYRYSERRATDKDQPRNVDFVHVPLTAETPYTAELSSYEFAKRKSDAAWLVVERSEDVLRWRDLSTLHAFAQHLPITHRAVRLFYALLAIDQYEASQDSEYAYVPFRPQLFTEEGAPTLTLHLVADRVPRKLLGASAWYHDQDDRVASVTVPKTRADLWRVGWTVADVLGVAADMSGETGERIEQLPNIGNSAGDEVTYESLQADAKKELEGYVLRQQLRKLQGAFISEAQVETEGVNSRNLPATVCRALELLRTYPAEESLHAQVRHLLVIEAESRSMALRLQRRSAGDLRHTLHQVFPDVLARLPLWALEWLKLRRTVDHETPLRPELELMLSLYRAMYPAPPSPDDVDRDSFLRVALALAAVCVGLRGCVAALWGASVASGLRRMPNQLDVPAGWDMYDPLLVGPEGDYKAMRKWLLDEDWAALCKASPWQWMLALIGLLEDGYAKAFDPAEVGGDALKNVYSFLCAWQSNSGSLEEAAHMDEAGRRWPFDALPIFTSNRCDELMQQLPIAIAAIDHLCGMRVIRVEAPAFGRGRNTADFVDAAGSSWQLTKPQLTSLYDNTVEQRRSSSTSRVLKVWTETRRTSDNDLLAVHTLDAKLGAWLQLASVQPDDVDVLTVAPPRTGSADDGLLPVEAAPARGDDTQSVLFRSIESPLLNARINRGSPSATFDHLREWQLASWKQRFGAGTTSEDSDARVSSHFRVAMLQWQVTDSYSHPIAEAGINGLPLGGSSMAELRNHLAGTFKLLNKAAKRDAEFRWEEERNVISWPEHRRRVFLREALKACKQLNVHLLVLPEVSVRPDTVSWLKKELRQHPNLAVLAGTYRHFGDKIDSEHLMEKLTLLWQPDAALAKAFGGGGSADVIQFERGKKYRAVAAHELFRPDTNQLAPLFTEERLIEKLGDTFKGGWSSSQLKALIQALIHAPTKLRYCMELICSELFLLTSPANRKPLQQELAKVLKQFGHDASQAGELVNGDFEALGELLTVAQSNRERRSVLLVPACTTRTNDYWHAGQASVLASGTATVFCNTSKPAGAGGSCFIGIDSVVRQNGNHTGTVHLLTPYHGWHKGILQPNGKGALSPTDQALVVVDLDPVHVVSGRPRPQLLPEPMSLVAYLPIVEVINKQENSKSLSTALEQMLTAAGQKLLHRQLSAETFPASRGALHERDAFRQVFERLLTAKRNGELKPDVGGESLDQFSAHFGDEAAVRERIMAWLKDSHQQPAPKAGKEQLEPAWLDFLVADLTWDAAAEYAPSIRVPVWLS